MNNDIYSDVSSLNTDQANVLLKSQTRKDIMHVNDMYNAVSGSGSEFGISGQKVPYTENPLHLTKTPSYGFRKNKLAFNYYTLQVDATIPASCTQFNELKQGKAEGKFKKADRVTQIDTIKKDSKKLEKSVPGPSQYKKDDFIRYQHKPILGKTGKSIGLSQNSTVNYLGVQSPAPGHTDIKSPSGMNSTGSSKQQSLTKLKSKEFKYYKPTELKKPIEKHKPIPGPGSYPKSDSGYLTLMKKDQKAFTTKESRFDVNFLRYDNIYGKINTGNSPKHKVPGVGSYELLKTFNLNRKLPFSTGPVISHLGKSLSSRHLK